MSIAMAALGSVKLAYDAATAALGFNETTKINLAISDILDKLMVAQRQANEAVEQEAALFQRIRELEGQVRELEEKKAQLERYERKRFFPGSVAYVLKDGLAGGGSPHYACANCYEDRQKVISLQPTDRLGARRTRLHFCPSCKSEFPQSGTYGSF